MTKDHVSKGVRVRVPYCALTPDQGRTRENNEPSSHGRISPASVGRVSGYVKAYPVSPASLRDRTRGYGPRNRRSNRRLETLLVYRNKQGGVMTTIPIRKFWHRLYVSQNGARAAVAQW